MTKPIMMVATWEHGLFAIIGDQRAHEIVNQPVRGLASDGRGGALAIVGGHSLCRRASNGEWATVASSELDLSCCMAVRDDIFAGTDNARLLRLSQNDSVFNPVEGFDHTAGRDSWFAGSAIVNGQRMGPPLGIRSVAASSDGSVLFANVHVGGIPRCMDGGKTWQPTIAIHTDVHEVQAHPGNPAIVVAASAVGLCISRDAGATWTIERDGLHASHCSAVAFSGDDILVSAATDPFAAQGRVYRRPLKADASLSALEGGMPEWTDGIVDTGCIAAKGPFIAVIDRGSNDRGGNDRGGNLYGSDDFGKTWSRWSTGFPASSGVLIPA